MRSRLMTAIALGALTCVLATNGGRAAPSQALAKVTTLPLQPFGTQPAVEVTVNGRGPYLFLVDTGASGVARIDYSVVEALKLPIVGQETASGATKGGDAPIRRVAVRVLGVGDRRYRDLQPLSRSYNTSGEYLPDIGGILALNLFADELLTIDLPKRQMRITTGELPAANGRTILAYEERGGVMHVPIRIGKVSTTALVDTGTDRSIDLPASVIRQIALQDFPHPVGQSEGVTGKIGIAEVTVDGDLQLGAHTFHNPSVTFSEAFEYPILGSVFFHDFAITIDQKNKRIQFVRGRVSRRPLLAGR
jgi:predicted aspartyl protease